MAWPYIGETLTQKQRRTCNRPHYRPRSHWYGRICLLVGIAALLVQSSCYCQSSSATIAGLVLDPSGAAVTGCQIVGMTLDGVIRNHTVSAHDGNFHITVPADGGQVTVSCKGFATIQRTFKALPGKHLDAVFRVQIADVTETVTVDVQTLGLSLEQSSNQESQSLTGETITELPVVDEDYITFMSRFIDPSVTGAQGTSLVVNGVEGGNFYQAPNAIKSLEVNQDQYSPAYASAGRGRLALVTTSGTSRLHGSLSFALRDHVFDAAPDFSPIKPTENREDYQATATGPIGRSQHLHFAASGQMKKDDTFAIVNAITASGPLVLASPTPYYRDKVGGSLYFDDGNGKQWVVGLGRTDEVHHNGSVGGLYLASIADFTEYTGHFIDVQNTELLSPHTLNQVRLALGQEGLLTQDTTNGPQVNVAGAFISGSDQETHSYKQYILSGNELVSTGDAKNTLRMGLDIPELSLHTDNDQTDRDGIYSYPSLAAYETGKPDLFTITQGDGRVRFISLSAALFVEDTRQFGSHTTLMAGARYYFQNIYHNRATHVAPRTELARSFGRQSHTVVRLGAGLFFDRILTTQFAELLQFNGQRLNRYILNNPPSVVTSTSGTPPSFMHVSPTATIPYVAQWSTAFEQQLTNRVTFSAQGTMNAGVHQLRMLDVNAPTPPLFASSPDSELGQVLSSESEGHSKSESMDLMLKINSLHGMTQQLRYRVAKSLNDTDGFSYIPANSHAPEQDASFASYDQRQNLSLLSTWSLPGRFTLGTVLQAGSGLPYNELLGEDINHDGTANDRPAGVPRNSLRMESQATLDLRLGRNISLGKGKDSPSLALSASAFNITNHANHTSYQGVVTSSQFRQPLTAGPPRQFQFNATVNF